MRMGGIVEWERQTVGVWWDKEFVSLRRHGIYLSVCMGFELIGDGAGRTGRRRRSRNKAGVLLVEFISDETMELRE